MASVAVCRVTPVMAERERSSAPNLRPAPSLSSFGLLSRIRSNRFPEAIPDRHLRLLVLPRIDSGPVGVAEQLSVEVSRRDGTEYKERRALIGSCAAGPSRAESGPDLSGVGGCLGRVLLVVLPGLAGVGQVTQPRYILVLR